MSHTYKYPRGTLDETIVRDGFEVNARIKQKLKRQKQTKRKRKKVATALKKFISFRDKQRARV